MKILNDWANRLRGQLTRPDRRIPKDVMLIIFLTGILIYVALLPTSGEEDTYFDSYDIAGDAAADDTDYASQMAAELEEFLAGVEGVGSVRVLIYTEPEATASYLTQTSAPEIRGIVIAATGAADEALRVRLTRMAMSLYGLEANKIEILTLSEQK